MGLVSHKKRKNKFNTDRYVFDWVVMPDGSGGWDAHHSIWATPFFLPSPETEGGADNRASTILRENSRPLLDYRYKGSAQDCRIKP